MAIESLILVSTRIFRTGRTKLLFLLASLALLSFNLPATSLKGLCLAVSRLCLIPAFAPYISITSPLLLLESLDCLLLTP